MAQAQVLPFATVSVQQEPFVVRITIHQEHGDDNDFKDIIGAVLKVFTYQRPVALIIDATALKIITKQGVKDIRAFMRSNRPTIEAFLRASSIIVRSVLIKNIINTIFKIQPPARPNLIVNSPEEAEAFIAQF